MAEFRTYYRLAALARTTPALATLHQEKPARYYNVLTPEIARRLGSDPRDATDPRPHALIAAAFSCLEAAVEAWIAGDGTRPLAQIFHHAMESISHDSGTTSAAGSVRGGHGDRDG